MHDKCIEQYNKICNTAWIRLPTNISSSIMQTHSKINILTNSCYYIWKYYLLYISHILFFVLFMLTIPTILWPTNRKEWRKLTCDDDPVYQTLNSTFITKVSSACLFQLTKLNVSTKLLLLKPIDSNQYK